eukprot:1151446-Pyramimonas_sp.AAC.1
MAEEMFGNGWTLGGGARRRGPGRTGAFALARSGVATSATTAAASFLQASERGAFLVAATAVASESRSEDAPRTIVLVGDSDGGDAVFSGDPRRHG